MQAKQDSVATVPSELNSANSDIMLRTPITRRNINNCEETKDDTDRNGESINENDIPSVATELDNDSDDEEDNEIPQNVHPNDPFHQDNWEVYEPLAAQTTARETRTGVYDDGLNALPNGYQSSKGPARIPLGTRSESHFLELLFTNEILERFVQQSNEFNWNQEVKFWKQPQSNLTVAELKKFFAVILYMGIQKLPNRDMYWRRFGTFRSDFVRNSFTKNRFDIICKVLHYTDTSTIENAERRQLNHQNPFWTVDDFIDELAHNFQAYYNLGREIDVDEMCIPFKGRFAAKNYNPNKPNKWHIKGYGLNDSETGYLYNVRMYKGRNEQRP